jgi:uncharacterized protein YbjT (DUF2867 family)
LPASPSGGVNSITGEGLAKALAGAPVVVDVTNSPSFEDKAVLEFFQISTRNLLAAEAAAGVKHHVAVSIVGIDGLPACGYFRAKVAQEALITASPVPYTIVRATQFFEFVGGVANSATEGKTVRLPDAFMQPIATSDLAAFLAEVAVAGPRNGIVEVAGPELISFEALVGRFLKAKGDDRTVVADAKATYFGTTLESRSLTPRGAAQLGATRFDDWLSRTTAS